jgi:hypothetical protein
MVCIAGEHGGLSHDDAGQDDALAAGAGKAHFILLFISPPSFLHGAVDHLLVFLCEFGVVGVGQQCR